MSLRMFHLRVAALLTIVALLSTSHPAVLRATDSVGDYCKPSAGYCVFQTSLMGSYAAGGYVCKSNEDPYCTTCPRDDYQTCGAFGQSIAYHRLS